MKKALFIFAAIITCSVYSCKKNEIELLEQPIIQNIDDNLVKYTFTAVVNDKLTDADTKASVSRAGAFSWQKGDALVFFTEDGDSADAVIDAVDGSTATITVTTEKPRSAFVSAIYPAAAAAAKDKVSFNARGPIVVSAVDGGTLTFYHIGSLINVKFTDIPSDTKSVVFESHTSIMYDGSFEWSGRVPSLIYTGLINKLVIPATTADEDKDITICVPSVNLSNGFSVALNDKVDGTGRNLFKKSTATERDLKTNRPVLLNMKKLAYVAPKYFYLTTTGTTYGVTKLPMIQTSENTYELALNSVKNAAYFIFDEYNEGNINGYYDYGTLSEVAPLGDMYLRGTNNWDPGTQMCSLGEWRFLRAVDLPANYEYKFFDGGGWIGADTSLSEGTYYWIGREKNSNGKIPSADVYDIYVDSAEWKAYFINNGEDSPIDAGTYIFSYDKSSEETTVTRQRKTVEYVFNNGDNWFETHFCIAGGFNSWADQALTYVGNHCYKLEGITITGSTPFLFRETNSSLTKWVGGTSSGYGYAYRGDGGDIELSLTAGTYDLYVNAYSWYDNKGVKYMFVKR